MITPQSAFGDMLERVTGQAFIAGGYRLALDRVQQAGGLFRYEKEQGAGRLVVGFQVLAHVDAPARFRVILTRTAGGSHPLVQKTLARLVWEDFGVRVLPGPDHWWTAATPQALREALLEAGTLAFGYGIPWLEGTLIPPDEAPPPA